MSINIGTFISFDKPGYLLIKSDNFAESGNVVIKNLETSEALVIEVNYDEKGYTNRDYERYDDNEDEKDVTFLAFICSIFVLVLIVIIFTIIHN